MFKHILVPTDGSSLSEGTVSRAVTFAREAGARITFFYAQPDFPMPIYGEGALIDPTTPEQFAKSAAAEAQGILAKAKAVADAEGVVAATDTVVNEVPYRSHHRRRRPSRLRPPSSWLRTAAAASPGCCSAARRRKVLTHSKTPVLVYR